MKKSFFVIGALVLSLALPVWGQVGEPLPTDRQISAEINAGADSIVWGGAKSLIIELSTLPPGEQVPVQRNVDFLIEFADATDTLTFSFHIGELSCESEANDFEGRVFFTGTMSLNDDPQTSSPFMVLWRTKNGVTTHTVFTQLDNFADVVEEAQIATALISENAEGIIQYSGDDMGMTALAAAIEAIGLTRADVTWLRASDPFDFVSFDCATLDAMVQ